MNFATTRKMIPQELFCVYNVFDGGIILEQNICVIDFATTVLLSKLRA